MENKKINPIKMKIITSFKPVDHQQRFVNFTHDEKIEIEDIESKVVYDEDLGKQYITFITYRIKGENLS